MFRFIGFVVSGVFRVFALLGTAFVLLVSSDALTSHVQLQYPQFASSAQLAIKQLDAFKDYLREGLHVNAAPAIADAVVKELQSGIALNSEAKTKSN